MVMGEDLTPCGTCLSLNSLFHLVQYFPDPSTLSQKVRFPSLLQPGSTLVCKCTTAFFFSLIVILNLESNLRIKHQLFIKHSSLFGYPLGHEGRGGHSQAAVAGKLTEADVLAITPEDHSPGELPVYIFSNGRTET